MDEKKLNEINFDEFSAVEIGQANAEVTNLINETQDIIDKCNEALGGDKDE